MHLSLRWDKRPPNWWNSRLKPKDSHTLTMHNIYVLPTRAGWMMLVTVAVLMLATINYQLSLGYVLIFLLMGAGIVGIFLTYFALSRMTLKLATSRELRGKVGEAISIAIDVEALHSSNIKISTENLVLRFDRAGSQPLPRLVCETRYPLGLLRLWSVWRPASHIQTDPPDAAPVINPEPPKVVASDGMKTDIRAYRMGDAPRDVLWKSVAKRPDTPSNWGVRTADDNPPESQETMLRRTRALPSPLEEDAQAQNLWHRAQQRDGLLLSALLFIALPFFQHLVWWYPLFGASLIAWRLVQLKTPGWHSAKWLQPLLVLALGVLVWIPFRSFSGIEASVSACVGLLGIKALELPHQKDAATDLTRDHWVLIFLGIFTLSAHFLVSQSITSSVAVVLGLTALLYVLVITHSKDKQALRTTLTLVICGAPFMAVMFLLFPRFAPLWSLQAQKAVAQTGLTSEMRVGDMGEISRDNKVMFRLQMNMPPNLDSKDIYLRSYVLPRFDGRTWSSYRQALQDAPKVKPQLDSPSHLGRAYVLTPDGEKPYADVITADVANGSESLTRTYLQTAASLPLGSNPRTAQWIQGLRGDARFQNFTIKQWSDYVLGALQSGGYRYTLAPGSYGLHVVDELLFDRKLGFCEHYATAYVVAMRSIGIPARVVTGYQGAEINPIDGLQVVRNSNAHAWAEYWEGTGEGIGQGRWHRVDPTAVIAPARIQSAEGFNQAPQQLAEQGRGVWSNSVLAPIFKSFWRVRQSWEATNHAWQEWFAGYNQGAQMSLLKRMGFDNPSWKDLVQLLDAALLVLLLIAIAVYVLRSKAQRDPWLLLLQAIRSKALQQGAVLAEHATPREIAQAMPKLTPPLREWLLALEAARYGNQNTIKMDIATLKRQLKSI